MKRLKQHNARKEAVPDRPFCKGIFLVSTAASILLFPVSCFASSNVQSANWTGGDSLDSLMGAIIGMMLTIARYAGMGLTVWGVVKTVMAYKDDNTNEITQGIRLAIVGIFLIALKSILSGLGLVS